MSCRRCPKILEYFRLRLARTLAKLTFCGWALCVSEWLIWCRMDGTGRVEGRGPVYILVVGGVQASGHDEGAEHSMAHV